MNLLTNTISNISFGDTYVSSEFCYTELDWTYLNTKERVILLSLIDQEEDYDSEYFPILLYKRKDAGIDVEHFYIAILEVLPSERIINCITDCITHDDFTYAVSPVELNAIEKISLIEKLR